MKQHFNKIFILFIFVLVFVAGAHKTDAVLLQRVDELTPIDLDGGGGGSSSGTTTTPTVPANTSPLFLNVNGVSSSYKTNEDINFTLSSYYNACNNTTINLSGGAYVRNQGGGSRLTDRYLFTGTVDGGVRLYEYGTVKAPTTPGSYEFVIDLSAQRVTYTVYNIYNGHEEDYGEFLNMASAESYMNNLQNAKNLWEVDKLSLIERQQQALMNGGDLDVKKVYTYLLDKELTIPFTVTSAEPTVEVHVNNSRTPNPITKSAAMSEGVTVTWNSNTENCECTASEPYIDSDGKSQTSCGKGGGVGFIGRSPNNSISFKVSKTTTFSVKCSN